MVKHDWLRNESTEAIREECWADEHGEVRIRRLTARVLLTQMDGRVGLDAVPFIKRTLAHEFGLQPPMHAFYALGSLVGYHTDVRVETTRMILRNRPAILSVHAHAGSKLVGMMIAVADLTLGGIVKVHATPQRFDAALRGALDITQSGRAQQGTPEVLSPLSEALPATERR